MGNGQSHTSSAYLKSVGAPPMFPVKRSKQQEYSRTTDSSKKLITMQKPLSRPPFSCTWSVQFPSGPSPTSRCGQCQIYDDEKDSLIIAYGINPAGQFLNDMWVLDLNTLVWRQVPVCLHEPRSNARAVLYNREMIIFGGTNGTTYFSDLHSVNIDTGNVTNFDSSSVTPRENPLLFLTETSLCAWSGFSGQLSIEFDEFDFESVSWSIKNMAAENGRRAATCVADPNSRFTYIFGSTRGHPLSRFDRETQEIEVMRCQGTAPPPELQNAMLTIAGSFLFVFGGEMESSYSYLYALDLKRFYWFPFYVLPDNNTTVLDDGEMTSAGIFKMPRQHSGAFAFSRTTRSLVCTMGSLFLEPAPLSVIYIGNALAILSLRSDMLEVLEINAQ